MPVQIDLFYAPHCSACRSVRPKLMRLAAAYKDDVMLRELNVVEHLDEAVSAGVLTTPTLVIGGKARLSGAISEVAFITLLRELKVTVSK